MRDNSAQSPYTRCSGNHNPIQILTRLQNHLPPPWRFTNPSASTPVVSGESVYFTTPYTSQLRLLNGTAYGGMAADINNATVFDSVEMPPDAPEETNLLQ